MKRVTVTINATYVLPKKGEGNSISTSKICIKILFIPRLKVWNETYIHTNFHNKAKKPELYGIVKLNKGPAIYKVDEFLKRKGHEVLRLPP
jgi:hypothetical protein